MQQFHFHSPAEHTIEGVHPDLEMHVVHAFSDVPNDLAVLGFCFKVMEDDAESPFVRNVMKGRAVVDLLELT